jgi:putative SOS response-associated peptidase YedK
MCGRFTLTLDGSALSSLFGFVEFPQWIPRFNIAPCQNILGIRNKVGPGNSVTEAVPLRWGLVPRWAKDTKGGAMMINARSETAREKPAFRPLVQSRRCLIPADGFYEWKTEGGIKKPYWFSFPDRRTFVFAALWETYTPPEQVQKDPVTGSQPSFPLETCSILTTQAQGWLREFHERMPVLLEKEDWPAWLDTKRSVDPIWDRIVGAFPGKSMVSASVSTRVNRVSEEGPGLLEAFESTAEPVAVRKTGKKRPEPDQPGLFD